MLERVPAQVLFTRGDETASRLRALVDAADWVCIAAGFARVSGLETIGPRLLQLAAERRAFLLSGDRAGQLTSDLVALFRAQAPDALRVVPSREGVGMMHAKVWLIQPENPAVLWAFIGSANLSRSALVRNQEVGVWMVLPSASPDATRLTEWFRAEWAAGYVPVPEQFEPESASSDSEPRVIVERELPDGSAEAQAKPGPGAADAARARSSTPTSVGPERAAVQVVQQPQLQVGHVPAAPPPKSAVAPPVGALPEVDPGALEVEEHERREWTAQPSPVPPEPTGRHDPLFGFQLEAIQSIDAMYEALQRAATPFTGVLSLPTGAGKTKIAAWWALSRFVKEGKQVLWIAHRSELLNQAYRTLHEHVELTGRPYLSTSFIDAARKDPSGAVVLASAPSLINARNLLNRRAGVARFDLIVFDEAHHAIADETKKMLLAARKHAPVPILGLTATPYRTGMGTSSFLRDFFTARVVYERTFGEIVEAGFLARPEWEFLDRLPGSKIRLSGADLAAIRRRGEFVASVLSRIAEDEEWNRDVIQRWCSGTYGQTLVFASNVDHAESLTRRLKRRGVSVAYVIGDTPSEERKQILDDFKAARLQVLVNVNVLTEGTDLPSVQTVLLARPTLSPVLYRQMIGRGARRDRAGNKTRFRVLDCVQNSLFHHSSDLHLAGEKVRAELERSR